MSKPVILSLGPKDVIREPEELLRTAFIQAFTADASQSALFDEVFSFQDINASYGSNPSRHAAELEVRFGDYLKRLFPEGVTVSVIEKNPGQDVQYTLEINASVSSGGSKYHLTDALILDPTKDIAKLRSAIG